MSKRLDKFMDNVAKHAGITVDKTRPKVRAVFYHLYKTMTVKQVVAEITKAKKAERTEIRVL